ncbi:DUF5719 family protein [Streptacidiphilus rugosus]|uniref:DUF5719 family protein n=1 Tax=Streptacidiphilus rugosus TaxID=405783 RepID=UPI00068ECDCC|nr:DUF5719 family protein [Streptacidiphilus rugosus]
MMNRTTQSLLGALGVLALALGIAELRPPQGQAAATGDSVRTAVTQTSLLCPPPLQGVTGSTVYSLAVPGHDSSTGSGGGASLTPITGAVGGAASPGTTPSPSGSPSGAAKPSPSGAPAGAASPAPLAQQSQVGGSTTGKAVAGANAPGVVAVANGSVAPGFTVQQTTTSNKGLSGAGCTRPGTDFWFVGADSVKTSSDYLELTNASPNNSDVDVQIFGTAGEVDTSAASSVSVPANGTSSLLLSTLVQPGNDNQTLAVHVLVRSGQIAAALHAATDAGDDWVPPTTMAPTVAVPGLPGDVHQYNLAVAVASGDSDADLKVQLASQSGWITPAGHETVHVKAGMLTMVNLGDVTHGQPGLLRLVPSDPKQATPVVAGVEATSSSRSDTAYLASVAPITQRGTVAGNTGGDATLLLTAPNGAASVTVATLGNGGTPTTKTVQIPAGSTVGVPLTAPSGAATFAVTVTPASGGPVYAARELARKSGLTIQQISDDGSTVMVPSAIQNPAILVQ